ncbi:hypothetical protein [Nesterenkonia lutea]|uniref:Cell division protein FtsW (Lipid II flippase) n=1 Tax=Nesterenkonia lutea TaxID=272919 RepID=A0ABR9JBM1_9MICC|nr:hypothetical protein [Nesterenkonia lutea]MBE1523185.1 cell division protein FtsW (lipid II flippase) [Nesterenkonia lutea]
MATGTTERRPKGRFWTTWQTVMACLGVPLIAWMYLAPRDLRLTGGWYLLSWVAILLVASLVAGPRRKT